MLDHIHIKVKWAAVAGALVALLTALTPTVGLHEGPTLASVLTALSAVLAGYAAPSAGHVEAQDVL